MQSLLSVFHRIIAGNLSPWLPDHVGDQKYITLTHDLPAHSYQFQPLYKVNFPNPVFPKRKYYKKLIESAAIEFFNCTHDKMKNALSDDHKKFVIDTALRKQLNPLLTDVAKIILEKGYNLELLTSHVANLEPQQADAIYIIQLLKFYIICLYQEVQDPYKVFSSEHQLSVEDILLNIFKEPLSQKDMISTQQKIFITVEEQPIVKPQLEDDTFIPIRGNVRLKNNNILTYDEIIEEKNRFANLEISLVKRQIIDKDYNFQNKPHGNRIKLAAVYHVYFRKGLFQKYKFPGRKLITVEDVQSFLNYRYKVDLKKQFTEFKRLPATLTDFLKRDPGIEYLD